MTEIWGTQKFTMNYLMHKLNCEFVAEIFI